MRLTVSQALVRFLAAQSVERDGVVRPFFAGCIGIFGHGNVAGIGQALQQESPALRFHQARNEQAMVHLATGYARQSMRLGAFACTTSIGPGATNLVTGAALATINRLPVLLLPGDTFATRRADPVLQQLERFDDATVTVNDALRPVSAFFDRVCRPEQLVSAAIEAMRVLTDPAAVGAVTLAIPQDVQVEGFEVPDGFCEPAVWPIERRPPDERTVRSAVRTIAAARRPLLVAGGGLKYSEAAVDLRDFAEQCGIPVAETQSGRGALPSAHPLSLGGVGVTGTAAANDLAAEADVVIGIGTRWSDFTTASNSLFAEGVEIVNVNVNRADALKQAGLAVVADAREALRRMTLELRDHHADPPWRERIETARSAWLVARERIVAGPTDPGTGAAPEQGLPQASIIGLVNDAAGEDGTVVCAAGSLPGELHRLWQASGADSYHVEYGYSCMGYELAGGIGAKLAAPDREVFVLLGDGSWLMMNGELVTAVLEGIRIIVVLVDNSGFASIGALSRSLGQTGYGTILAAATDEREPTDEGPAHPHPPIDLAASAEALGAEVHRARTAEELRGALASARAADGPVVIYVRSDRHASVPAHGWWDVPVAEVSTSDSVNRAREEYEAARGAQRRPLGRTG